VKLHAPVRALHVEGEKVEHIYDCSKDLDLVPHSVMKYARTLKRSYLEA